MTVENTQPTLGIEDYKFRLALDPNDQEALTELCKILLDLGQITEAENYLLKLNDKSGDNPEIKVLLGIMCQEQNKYEEALIWYQQALAIYPNHLQALTNLGHMQINLGEKEAAKQNFLNAIEANPHAQDAAEAYSNLGILYIESQQNDKAINCFKQAVKLRPDFYYLSINLAHALVIEKEYDVAYDVLEQLPDTPELVVKKRTEQAKIRVHQNDLYAAIDLIQPLLETKPNDVDINSQLGEIYLQMQDYKQAEKYFDAAVVGNPSNTDLLMTLAGYAHERKDFDKAKNYLEQLLNADPANAEAYATMGYICAQQGNTEGAINCCEIALAINPDHANAFRYLGLCYYQLGQTKKSAEYFLKALELMPDDPDVLANLGSLYQGTSSGKMTRTLCFNSIQNLIQQYEDRQNDNDPIYFTHGQASAIAHYAFNCLINCYWDDYNKIKPLLKIVVDDQLKEGLPLGMTPFISQITLSTEDYQLEITRQLSERNEAPEEDKFKSYTKRDPNKLHIGYISPDFNSHVVGFLINDLFSFHDRSRFIISAYSLRDVQDELQQTIIDSVDNFIDCTKLSNHEAAKKIHQDQVDILIDLAGYTAHARPRILGFQPAPVQVHFIGQAGTMGARFIQYHLCTDTLVPEKQRNLYSEQLVYLPDTPIAIKQLTIPEECPTKADYNLPEKGTIYCCFNNPYRFEEEVFKTWMAILTQVPDSVLWLTYLSNEVIINLQAQAQKYGISPERLVFRPHIKLNSDWHHRLADVYLDTFALSGGTTSVLSAWAGLPVITIAGETPQALYGAGFMAAADMHELIVNNKEEYINLAVELGLNPEKNRAIKSKMLQKRKEVTLFDQQKYCKQLEQAYDKIWQDHQAGHPNKVIRLSEK